MQYEESATVKKLQRAKSATREKCKTKILRHVKVQYKILQYVNGVQHEKITTQKSVTMKWFSMKKVQYEK